MAPATCELPSSAPGASADRDSDGLLRRLRCKARHPLADRFERFADRLHGGDSGVQIPWAVRPTGRILAPGYTPIRDGRHLYYDCGKCKLTTEYEVIDDTPPSLPE